MKESLHNQPLENRDKQAAPSGQRVIDDVDAVRAMAHPHRVAILHLLLSGPPRTATECAIEVGGSPSACSYHLRELARFGLVERVDASGDGRSRPWRAASVGYSVGSDWIDESPARRAAGAALGRAELVENQRLVKRFLDQVDRVDQDWRSASDFHTFELLVTPDELHELNDKVADVLRDYRAPVRSQPPEAAAAVHVIYQAFLRLGAQ